MPADTAEASASTSAPDRSHEARWGGHERIFEDGYVAVPVTFLKYMDQMAPYVLTPAEALFVIQLMAFKWDGSDPFPSYGTIAERMGISDGYARKLARRLESKGFIDRKERQGRSNAFDLSGLFEELAEQIREDRGPLEEEEDDWSDFSDDALMGDDDLPF